MPFYLPFFGKKRLAVLVQTLHVSGVNAALPGLERVYVLLSGLNNSATAASSPRAYSSRDANTQLRH